MFDTVQNDFENKIKTFENIGDSYSGAMDALSALGYRDTPAIIH